MRTSFLFLIVIFGCINQQAVAQAVLPPIPAWSGKSEQLIAPAGDKWLTHAERSEFTSTPSYTETMAWFDNLCSQSKLFQMVSIGTSANNQSINMLIASSENAFTAEKLVRSTKKLILIQAGIHAGEIDGKDAGMMLLRDIAFRNKKRLLDEVNILFVPILSVDGHERRSPFNRVNQRGPEDMGWRTNANNLNLNRDYTKLDTEEITAIVKVINDYDPDLYLDLHVTDGADYQYDITFGFDATFSPQTGAWLREKLTPFVHANLKEMGHIPGPLVFAANERDFREGMMEYAYSPRYSNNYGDLRHLPSILLENHSLKPFRQRVLGTYVFLRSFRCLGLKAQRCKKQFRKIKSCEMRISYSPGRSTRSVIQ
jgi:murein tripeptide amidase MpaA